MAKEIERKFLVTDDCYRLIAKHRVEICQGYLSTQRNATVRVRITDNRGFITVKSATEGCTRDEWEYEIPVGDARQMLRHHLGRLIDKTRYIVDYMGHKWEVDEFHGDHAGLIVAEIELSNEHEDFPLPPFIGREVTGDPAYYNSSLSQ